jgi:hypothetical protein
LCISWYGSMSWDGVHSQFITNYSTSKYYMCLISVCLTDMIPATHHSQKECVFLYSFFVHILFILSFKCFNSCILCSWFAFLIFNRFIVFWRQILKFLSKFWLSVTLSDLIYPKVTLSVTWCPKVWLSEIIDPKVLNSI